MEIKKMSNYLSEWESGHEAGITAVLRFLKEMKGLELREEFEAWANPDEYTKLNGEVVKRYG